MEEGVGGSLCFVQAGATSPVATRSPVISRLALVPESGATYSLSLPLFHRALHRSLHPPPLLYTAAITSSYIPLISSLSAQCTIRETSGDSEREGKVKMVEKSNVIMLYINLIINTPVSDNEVNLRRKDGELWRKICVIVE